MSDQFSQPKSILRSSSISTMSSAPVVRDDLADSSENSEASSSDSDFSFPAPSASSENFSSLNPNQLQVIVQDPSTPEAKENNAGTENHEGDKEGGFEDYF